MTGRGLTPRPVVMDAAIDRKVRIVKQTLITFVRLFVLALLAWGIVALAKYLLGV